MWTPWHTRTRRTVARVKQEPGPTPTKCTTDVHRRAGTAPPHPEAEERTQRWWTQKNLLAAIKTAANSGENHQVDAQVRGQVKGRAHWQHLRCLPTRHAFTTQGSGDSTVEKSWPVTRTCRLWGQRGTHRNNVPSVSSWLKYKPWIWLWGNTARTQTKGPLQNKRQHHEAK